MRALKNKTAGSSKILLAIAKDYMERYGWDIDKYKDVYIDIDNCEEGIKVSIKINQKIVGEFVCKYQIVHKLIAVKKEKEDK